MTGFKYSHAGYWKWNGSWIGNCTPCYIGKKTSLECANDCIKDKGCFAIDMDANATASIEERCFHYNNNTVLVSANEIKDDRYKAYIKC